MTSLLVISFIFRSMPNIYHGASSQKQLTAKSFSSYSPEAVTRRCSKKKKVFLKISQNSQKNNCARVSFLTKSLAKFLRTPIFIEHAWWLLLSSCGSCYSLQKPKQKFKDWYICSCSVTKYKITVALFLFCYFSKSKIYWHSKLHLKRVRTLKFTQCIESLNVGHLKRRKVK